MATQKQRTTNTLTAKRKSYAQLSRERQTLFDENVMLHNRIHELEGRLAIYEAPAVDAHERLEKMGLYVPRSS